MSEGSEIRAHFTPLLHQDRILHNFSILIPFPVTNTYRAPIGKMIISLNYISMQY